MVLYPRALNFVIGSSSPMLSLLSLLQTQRDWPGRVLADHLAVTPEDGAPRRRPAPDLGLSDQFREGPRWWLPSGCRFGASSVVLRRRAGGGDRCGVAERFHRRRGHRRGGSSSPSHRASGDAGKASTPDRMTPRTPTGRRFTPCPFSAPGRTVVPGSQIQRLPGGGPLACVGQVLIDHPARDGRPVDRRKATPGSCRPLDADDHRILVLDRAARTCYPFRCLVHSCRTWRLRVAAGVLANRFRASRNQPPEPLRDEGSS